jgi:hypothetical protein
LLLVALLLVAVLAAAGARIPGGSLGRQIAAKIVCAVELDETCAEASELVAEYGLETASLVREHAPWLLYEEGMRALPVDYRECREDECAAGPEEGLVSETSAGLPVTAFVHVADCRHPASAGPGIECSAERAGNLYIQFWFYYPHSATAEGTGLAREAFKALGRPGYHADDWESYQVRIGARGADSRAGSHHGYNYEGGARNWGSDLGNGDLREISEFAGLRPPGGWGPETGVIWVSGGSHAGHARDNAAKLADGDYPRATPGGGLTLIPLEPIARGEGGAPPSFAIAPPWFKEVWEDPEFEAG